MKVLISMNNILIVVLHLRSQCDRIAPLVRFWIPRNF